MSSEGSTSAARFMAAKGAALSGVATADNEWSSVRIACRHVEALLDEINRLGNALEITEKRLRHSEFHRTSNRRTMRARGRIIVKLCTKIARQRQALKEREGTGGGKAKRKGTAHTKAADLHHSLRRAPEDA